MTDVSDRYRRLSGQMEARLAAVTPEQWANPTPCEDWTARDLVGHLVDSSALFLGFVGRSMPEGGPAVADEPLGAFRHARDAIQAALDDPAVAQAEYEGFAGPSTFEQGVAQFLCGDLVMHQWDLARATGQDERLDVSG